MSIQGDSQSRNTEGGALPSFGDEALKAEIGMRLRQAVKLGGGNKMVSAKSGIPLRTLANLLDGQEMKVGQLVRVAAACQVSLDWLATGRLPVHPVEQIARFEAATGMHEETAPLDQDALESVLVVLDEQLRDAATPLPPAKQAKIVAMLYALRQYGHLPDQSTLAETAARLIALAT